MNRKIVWLILLSFVIIFSTAKGIYALYEEKPKEEKTIMQERGIINPQELKTKEPEYTPGQLIIKFKPQLGAQAGKFFKEGGSFKTLTGTDTLDNLNNKYRVKKIERIFKDLEVKGKAKGKDFITAVEDAQEIKKKFPQRSKRAPKDAKTPDLENIYLIELENPKADILAIAEEYKRDPNVAYAEPNYIVKVQMVPNDPYYSSTNSWGQGYDDLWGLKKIQAEQAWDISQGEGVIVAVIDTGIDYNHEDIAANVWINQDEIAGNGIDDDHNGYIDDVRGWDFVGADANYPNPDNNPMDGYGHGTHCAGTIAAIGNNNKGIIGVAPKAKVMAVKGLDNHGSGYESDLADCLIYAANNGADVLSNSWGGLGSSQTIEDAINAAHALGCVVVAAAGNFNSDVSHLYPANLDNVIAVAAFDENDQKCSFSNYGTKIDVAAPGGNGEDDPYNIISLLSSTHDSSLNPYIVGTKYLRLAGTSMACPHVSGVAALILSKNPPLSNEAVRQILQQSADDIGEPGKDISFGFGRINAYSAVTVPYIALSITNPLPQSYLKGRIDINGSAFIEQGFQEYKLYYAPLDAPTDITLIKASSVSVTDGLLGTWDTTQCSEGKTILMLKLFCNDNKVFTYCIDVTIDNINEPPVWKHISNQAVPIGGRFRFKIEAVDPDDPNTPWGNLTYSAVDLPPGAIFNAYHYFAWQLSESDRGIYPIKFTVQDNEHFIEKTVNLSVVNVEKTLIDSTNIGYNSYWGHCDIYENYLVWQGFGYPLITYDVYLYNLTSGQKTRITTDNRNQDFPGIFGNRIVWHDDRNGNEDIYMYDISAGREFQITSHPSRQFTPKIYGDRVIWIDDRNGSWDIYMYDFSTSKENPVIKNPHTKYGLGIYQDKIVWADFQDPLQGDIYMYDFSTGREKRITANIESQSQPDIFQDRIVWEDSRGDDYASIYLYDLSTDKETQISHAPSYQTNPKIYQNKVVWEDSRNGTLNPDIYMYDIALDQEIQVTNEPTIELYPNIYKDMVAWVHIDLESRACDVYIGKVNNLPAAKDQAITTNEDTAKSIILTGSDIDGTITGYTIATNPSHGVISGTGAVRTYTPAANYNGPDSFTFTVTDNQGVISAPATVSIIVTAVKDAPQLGTITPSSGTGLPNAPINFTTTYTDADGWQNIYTACLLINTRLNGTNCLYAYYDLNANKLYLSNDANTAWLGGYAPGSSYTIENSYAKLNCASTTVSGSGNTLTIKWNVTFKSTFIGSKKSYVYTYDDDGLTSGWAQKGTWRINAVPALGTVTPSSGSSLPNQAVNFTTTYSDADGWQDIQYVYFSVNTSTGNSSCFFGYYNQNTNKLYIFDDSGMSILGGYVPGTAYTIENSYAKLNCASTTVSGSGNTLTINWNVTFKSKFSGAKNTYLYVRDDSNASVGITQKGTWTINNPPQIGTITPSSGSSLRNTAVAFTTTYNDADGWQNISEVRFLVNTAISGSYCLLARYDRTTNKLYLCKDNDPNEATRWLGGFVPGSANTIENSYVKLNCASTTVSGSAATLTLKWNVTFKSTFLGSKNTYLYVKDKYNATNGWIQKGTWTIR